MGLPDLDILSVRKKNAHPEPGAGSSHDGARAVGEIPVGRTGVVFAGRNVTPEVKVTLQVTGRRRTPGIWRCGDDLKERRHTGFSDAAGKWVLIGRITHGVKSVGRKMRRTSGKSRPLIPNNRSQMIHSPARPDWKMAMTKNRNAPISRAPKLFQSIPAKKSSCRRGGASGCAPCHATACLRT